MALTLFASKKTPAVAGGVETSTIIETSPREPRSAAAAVASPASGKLRAFGLLFALFAASSAGLLVYQLRNSCR